MHGFHRRPSAQRTLRRLALAGTAALTLFAVPAPAAIAAVAEPAPNQDAAVVAGENAVGAGGVNATRITQTTAWICPDLSRARPDVIQSWMVFSGTTQLTEDWLLCAGIDGLTPNTVYTVSIQVGDVPASGDPFRYEGDVTFRTQAVVVAPPVTVQDITATSATVCAPDVIRPAIPYRWVVFIGPEKVTESGSPCQPVEGLQPETEYTLTLKIAPASAPDEELTSEGDVTFTTLPDDTPPALSYSLKGAATLKTLVKGSLPLVGSLDAVTFDTESPAFSADLFLEESTGALVALGFLPVTAKVLILPTAPLVGTLENGVLQGVQMARITIPNVSFFGITIAGGANCQAKQVSSIALKSVAPTFQPETGGTLAGSFAISNLAGCGGLTGLISPLTAGKGNAIMLNLTPNSETPQST